MRFPSLAKEGRLRDQEIVRSNVSSRPSAPYKEASRHFLDVASTPPWPRWGIGRFLLPLFSFLIFYLLENSIQIQNAPDFPPHC